MVKIKEVMKKHVVTVDPTFTMDAVAKIMSNNKIGSVIILRKNKPEGIVTREDIVAMVAGGRDPKTIKVKKLLGRSFLTASPNSELLSVTKSMIKKGVKSVQILKGGKLEGILTDKEILLTAPEMIDILSEKLKARVERVARPDSSISGICENCEGYSDTLHNHNGRWSCEDCSG